MSVSVSVSVKENGWQAVLKVRSALDSAVSISMDAEAIGLADADERGVVERINEIKKRLLERKLQLEAVRIVEHTQESDGKERYYVTNKDNQWYYRSKYIELARDFIWRNDLTDAGWIEAENAN